MGFNSGFKGLKKQLLRKEMDFWRTATSTSKVLCVRFGITGEEMGGTQTILEGMNNN